MRSRLTFPSAGMEDKFVWDRYNLHNNGIYTWDKHNIINETKYYWDKYALLEEKWYYWKQYELSRITTYNWNRYTMLLVDDTFAANNYVQHTYNTEISTKYLNLNKEFATTPVRDDTYAMTGSNVYLYRENNTYIHLKIADVKNNCFTCNPLYYGFVGVSYDLSYSYPYYYFTPDTRMYVDADNNNYLTFTNLYNTTRNIKNKPINITDSPTGSYYIELTMKWPTTLKNTYTYSKSANLNNKYSYLTGNTFYEMLNDGFWRQDSWAVYRPYKDKDSLTALSSENSTAYPTGLSGDYLYIKTADTYEIIKGDYLQQVSSKEQNTYPENGEKNGYWYETTVPGLYYWDIYKATISKYIFDEYGYYATTPQKYVCDKYELSAPGVTFKRPIQETDETTGEVYISDYIEITLGELTDVYWPEGGRNSTDIAFWMTLDDTYNDDSTYSGSTIKRVRTRSDYIESVLDYNKPISDGSNILYGKKMLDYTGAIGMGFSGTDYNRQHSYYLFTPETTWGRETGTGAIKFNNVRPMIFSSEVGGPDAPVYMDAGFGWEPSNTATTENKGCYVDYIHTIKREWNEDLEEWRINNQKVEYDVEITDMDPLFYKIPGYHYDAIGGFRYKDYENGYYYDIRKCYYNGKIGNNLGQRTSTSDLRDSFPKDLTSSTDESYVYVLVDQEYGNSYQKLGEVSSRDEYAYPQDGMIEGDNTTYYVYSRFEEDDADYLKGDFIESVESTNPNQYPQDKYQGQNWYVYTGNKLFQYKGNYIETVNDKTLNVYPIDGIAGGYWYVYQGYENNGPYKNQWVDVVESNQNDAYPTDGIQGNYWYVFKNQYLGYKLQINDSELMGGVTYKHNINPDKDFTIGCVSSAEIDFQYDNSRDDFDKYLDEDYLDYYTWQPQDNDWRLMGRFWITDADFTRNIVKVKAFDSILASDAFVDEFIENTTFPISLTNFFTSLCQFLGVTGKLKGNIANTTLSLADNFEAVNITARQLFQYIAEMAGGFIKSDLDGTITLTTYSSSGKSLNNSNYTTYTRQRFDVEPISGLTVKMNTDDLGVSAGDVETNPYIIENNPLFYAESTEEIKPAVNVLYNSIKNKTYRPATINLLQDFNINCGDIITVDGDTFYVMSKELSASGCKLECFGNQYREKQPTSINSDIIALRGKTNELFRDLEMTQSTLTDAANGLQSQITQTANEINSRVTNEVSGLESKITQTANSITSSVTDEINQAKSEIKQTTDSISLQVQNQGDLVAQLVLDVDGIQAKGYVTFTDLSGSGKTTINGDNITTGTISADRINLTGSISWGDLTQSCKNTIASYAGDTNLPDYIHSTYIDSTTIKSPIIQGGTLYAGNVYEGYCRMTSSGLNIVNDDGSNVCGIGWYPGHYNLPYVVLGAGVDDVGTNQGLIKKYSRGIWIGDSDGIFDSNEQLPTSGTGIFIDFVANKVYKYINGTQTEL